jgi:long-chain fatty acid transport protein
MAKLLRSLISGCTLLSLGASSAWANVGEAYGFGSRAAALGGATAAWGFDGFASYSNPAGLALLKDKKLVLSWALLEMTPQFTGIDNVITSNVYIGENQSNYGSVADDYRDTFGQTIGLTYQLFPESFRFSFGLTAYLPISHAAYMDTGETFVPEYFLYRARTQRPQIDTGVGLDLGRGLYAGAGLHVAYTLTSNATVFLNTTPGKPSTMRFASSLKPKLAPYLGLLYTNQEVSSFTGGEDTSEAGDGSAGLVVRLPVTSSNNMTLKSAARTFGDFATLDFNFKAASALYYDPLALELGGSYQYARAARAFLQLEYQFWSDFQPPALLIQDPTVENCSDNDADADCGINISGGNNPSFTYRNILVPRLGHELALSPSLVLRAGYYYRPSILKSLSTGAGNYLDPPKHALSAGAGFRFSRFLAFDVPCNLDLHLSYQKLVSQQIAKEPGDEAGNGSGNLKIGAPGYEAGGKVYGGGVSLTLAF